MSSLLKCKTKVSAINHASMSFVMKDIQTNIDKVKRWKETYQISSVEEGVMHERANKKEQLPHSFTDAIFWLNETLNFILVFVDCIKETGSVRDSFNMAYQNRLVNYHTFMTRGIFAIANRLTVDNTQILSMVESIDINELANLRKLVTNVDSILAGFVPK